MAVAAWLLLQETPPRKRNSAGSSLVRSPPLRPRERSPGEGPEEVVSGRHRAQLHEASMTRNRPLLAGCPVAAMAIAAIGLLIAASSGHPAPATPAKLP